VIDHTRFNVSNLELSKAFYLKALAPLGYGISLEFEGSAGFGALTGGATIPAATSGSAPASHRRRESIWPFAR